MAMKTGVMTIIRIEQILGIPWRVARPGTRPSYTNQTPLIYFNKNIYVYIYIVLYKKKSQAMASHNLVQILHQSI